MEPLPTTKWVMTWLCMYPANDSSSTRNKILFKVVGVTIFGINLCSVIVWIAFLEKLHHYLHYLVRLRLVHRSTPYQLHSFSVIKHVLSSNNYQPFMRPVSNSSEWDMFTKKNYHLQAHIDLTFIIDWIEFFYSYQISIGVDENAPGMDLLIQANSISEWIWPLALKLTVFYSCCNVGVSVASAVYCRSIYGYIKSDRVFHSMNSMWVILVQFQLVFT